MNDFLLIFRADYENIPKASPEELQARTQKWMNWVSGIAAREQLSERGNRLLPSGKVVRSNSVIADGPYVEIKESILGYSIVKAASIEEAIELTKGCPVFSFGGSVEVREVNAL